MRPYDFIEDHCDESAHGDGTRREYAAREREKPSKLVYSLSRGYCKADGESTRGPVRISGLRLRGLKRAEEAEEAEEGSRTG